MDDIKIVFLLDDYSKEIKFNDLNITSILNKINDKSNFKLCRIFVLNMFNSVCFEKINNSYNLEFIRNSIVTLSKDLTLSLLKSFIKKFIKYVKKNLDNRQILKLSFLGENKMTLNNLMIVKNTDTDEKELEIILHTSQNFSKSQYFYFFVDDNIDKFIFSCQNCHKFSYSIFKKNDLIVAYNNLQCINFDSNNDDIIDFNESHNKPFDWTYNSIGVNTKNLEFSNFDKIFLNNNISNYYGNTNYNLTNGIILGDQTIVGNQKIITTPPKMKEGETDAESFLYESIDNDQFIGYRIIYVYVEDLVGKVKIVRKCWDSNNDDKKYLPKYKLEYDVKKGHNCFIFKSAINNLEVKEEHVGLSIFSIQNENITSSCTISNSKVFDVLNKFICSNEKLKSGLGGVNDEPKNKKDLLNYEKYAKVLSQMILKNSINAPITIGIYSEWGSGKSFLLNQIKKIIRYHEYVDRKERDCICFNCCFNCKENYIIDNDKDDHYKLEEEGRLIKNCFKLCNPCCNMLNYCRKTIDKNYIFIEFNAWEYSGSDVLWAGLVKCMYDKLEEEFGTTIFRLIVYYYSTFNFCDFFCQIIKYLIVVGIGIIISMNIENYIASLISLFSGIILSVLAMLPGIKDFLVNIYKGESKILQDKLNKINNKVGFMAVVREKIETLSKILEKFNCQPIIFIDDIDRCTHDKAVQVLNAVKLLLSGSTKFYTFLAIDPRLVVKAIESSYKETIVKAGITGYDFIDKIVQIPFVLPKQDTSSKQYFIKEILTNINKNILLKNDKKDHDIKENEKNTSKIDQEEKLFLKQIGIDLEAKKENDKKIEEIMNKEKEGEIISMGSTNFAQTNYLEESKVVYEDSSDDEEKNKNNDVLTESIPIEYLEEELNDNPDIVGESLISAEEISIFNKYARFLDSNGRRLVRIINIYILSKNFYFDDKPSINNITNIFEKLIFSIILSEQWAYRTSFILLFLEIKYNSTTNFEDIFSKKSVKDIYDENIKKYIYKNDYLINLSYSDSRDDLFNLLVNEFEEFNAAAFYFTNKKYTFNLNPAITEEILREINKDDLKDFI